MPAPAEGRDNAAEAARSSSPSSSSTASLGSAGAAGVGPPEQAEASHSRVENVERSEVPNAAAEEDGSGAEGRSPPRGDEDVPRRNLVVGVGADLVAVQAGGAGDRGDQNLPNAGRDPAPNDDQENALRGDAAARAVGEERAPLGELVLADQRQQPTPRTPSPPRRGLHFPPQIAERFARCSPSTRVLREGERMRREKAASAAPGGGGGAISLSLTGRAAAVVQRAHAQSKAALERLRRRRVEEEERRIDEEQRQAEEEQRRVEEEAAAAAALQHRQLVARVQSRCLGAVRIQRLWRGVRARRRAVREQAVAAVVGVLVERVEKAAAQALVEETEDAVAAGKSGAGEDAAVAGGTAKEDVSSGEVLDVLPDTVTTPGDGNGSDIDLVGNELDGSIDDDGFGGNVLDGTTLTDSFDVDAPIFRSDAEKWGVCGHLIEPYNALNRQKSQAKDAEKKRTLARTRRQKSQAVDAGEDWTQQKEEERLSLQRSIVDLVAHYEGQTDPSLYRDGQIDLDHRYSKRVFRQVLSKWPAKKATAPSVAQKKRRLDTPSSNQQQSKHKQQTGRKKAQATSPSRSNRTRGNEGAPKSSPMVESRSSRKRPPISYEEDDSDESSSGEATAGSARLQSSSLSKPALGDVGYRFWKLFNDGWFEGVVSKIRPGARDGKDRRCLYSDGDSEDLSLKQLQALALAEEALNREACGDASKEGAAELELDVTAVPVVKTTVRTLDDVDAALNRSGLSVSMKKRLKKKRRVLLQKSRKAGRQFGEVRSGYKARPSRAQPKRKRVNSADESFASDSTAHGNSDAEEDESLEVDSDVSESEEDNEKGPADSNESEAESDEEESSGTEKKRSKSKPKAAKQKRPEDSDESKAESDAESDCEDTLTKKGTAKKRAVADAEYDKLKRELASTCKRHQKDGKWIGEPSVKVPNGLRKSCPPELKKSILKALLENHNLTDMSKGWKETLWDKAATIARDGKKVVGDGAGDISSTYEHTKRAKTKAKQCTKEGTAALYDEFDGPGGKDAALRFVEESKQSEAKRAEFEGKLSKLQGRRKRRRKKMSAAERTKEATERAELAVKALDSMEDVQSEDDAEADILDAMKHAHVRIDAGDMCKTSARDMIPAYEKSLRSNPTFAELDVDARENGVRMVKSQICHHQVSVRMLTKLKMKGLAHIHVMKDENGQPYKAIFVAAPEWLILHYCQGAAKKYNDGAGNTKNRAPVDTGGHLQVDILNGGVVVNTDAHYGERGHLDDETKRIFQVLSVTETRKGTIDTYAVRTPLTHTKLQAHQLVLGTAYFYGMNANLECHTREGGILAGVVGTGETVEKQFRCNVTCPRLDSLIEQGLVKEPSLRCDGDHLFGRSTKYMNGIWWVQPVSHRENIIRSWVREKWGEWLIPLCIGAYTGGNSTPASSKKRI